MVMENPWVLANSQPDFWTPRAVFPAALLNEAYLCLNLGANGSHVTEGHLRGSWKIAVPSGYVKIAIENDHRNSGFSH